MDAGDHEWYYVRMIAGGSALRHHCESEPKWINRFFALTELFEIVRPVTIAQTDAEGMHEVLGSPLIGFCVAQLSQTTLPLTFAFPELLVAASPSSPVSSTS